LEALISPHLSWTFESGNVPSFESRRGSFGGTNLAQHFGEG